MRLVKKCKKMFRTMMEQDRIPIGQVSCPPSSWDFVDLPLRMRITVCKGSEISAVYTNVDALPHAYASAIEVLH